MNKKAAIVLLSASLAFIIASVMLLQGAKPPIVLGDTQMRLADLPKEGELYKAYIDTSAKFALAEAMKMMHTSNKDLYTLCLEKNPACGEIPTYFKIAFKKHLDSFNSAYKQQLDVVHYEFKSSLMESDGKPCVELVGISTDRISVKKDENLTYLIKPSFRIKTSLEELNQLSTTPETIAIASFNSIVGKFQKCLKYDKTSCFCDESEINPAEMPEGYKISIITTAEKDKLFGGVEHQFKLLDKKGNVVAQIRRVQIIVLKGIFGAYEYIESDINKKLCYPGAFSKIQGYLIDKNTGKFRLYIFSNEANCKGVSKFEMVGIVKEPDYEKLKGAKCSEIGVKT